MRIKNRKFAAIVLAGILGVCMSGGCSLEQEANTEGSSEQNIESSSVTSGSTESVGTFETTDIEGTSYTEKVFGEYDLTMVNIFATWCTPCVQELPELQKLYEEMQSQGVNVVGIVTDTVDEKGNSDSEALKKAKELKEQAGVTYPFLVPDSEGLNGRLNKVQAFPTTIFVDKEGNIVGGTYEGSGGYEDWKEVVDNELSALKGEN